jgi:GT2 family glycosyltransferase
MKLARNVGFSEANNMAFSESRGDVVVLLNNDVELDEDWTSAILEALHSDVKAGSVACQLRQKKHPTLLDSAGFSLYTCGSVFSWNGYPPEAVDHAKYKLFGPVAAAAAYRRSALQDSGLFSREYFAYYEDTDLAFRLNLLGYHCVYAKKALGLHRGSATGQRASSFQRFQLRRNIELLYFTNMQGSLVWRHLAVHLVYELIALAGMTIQGQGGVWFKAKVAAWRMRAWIKHKRVELREKLVTHGAWSAGRRRVASLFVPTNQLVCNRPEIHGRLQE